MGIFSNIFKKKEQSFVDFADVRVDMHSHLIPGIDDGSKSMNDTIIMLKEFAALGFSKIITTPHIMSDFYRNTPDIILSGVDEVRNEIAKHEDLKHIDFSAAAEYYLDADFSNKLKNGPLLTFGQNYLLFEVSYVNEPENITASVFNMQSRGYRPVLAHPERYPFWNVKFEKYEEFFEKGILLQLNINSLSGHYGPGARKTAEKLIDKGMVSFIGSDCHKIQHLGLTKRTQSDEYLYKLLCSGNLLNNML